MIKSGIFAIVSPKAGYNEASRECNKTFNETPISWTIEATGRALQVDRLIVSNEYKEIAEVASECGFKVQF